VRAGFLLILRPTQQQMQRDERSLFGDHVTIDTVVLFNINNVHSIGKIDRLDGSDQVSMVKFLEITEQLLIQYSLSTVTEAEAPFAVKSGMVEVILMETSVVISRSVVLDVCFILPLLEVESGLLNLTGSQNCYYIRYQFKSGQVQPYFCSMLQPSVLETYSRRLIWSLNQSSSSIKKVFYHHPEQHSVQKSFRIPFSYETFYYLCCKLRRNADIIMYGMERKQRMILYFDDLSTKNSSRVNQINVIQILTSGGLVTLCEVLGVGIGVGVGNQRPSKSNPSVYCRLNDVLASLDLPHEVPPILPGEA
jgi:hypothetical protein